MSTIVAVSNLKGGVGKTDLSVNLSYSLAVLGKKILLVDMDPLANLTDYLITKSPTLTMSNLLVDDGVKLDDVILKTEFQNLDLVPASMNLSVAQMQLVNEVNMQFRLKRKLRSLDKYDFIFIDTPPSLCVLTVNVLTAANQLLVPVQTQFFALDGVVKLLNSTDKIREDVNPALSIGGFVLTMFDRRTCLSRDAEEKVRAAFGNQVFNTMIPVNVKLAESPSFHKPVLAYAPNSSGAIAYAKLAKEWLERCAEPHFADLPLTRTETPNVTPVAESVKDSRDDIGLWPSAHQPMPITNAAALPQNMERTPAEQVQVPPTPPVVAGPSGFRKRLFDVKRSFALLTRSRSTS